MRIAVYLPLLLSLLAPLGARPLAERCEPRLATWLLTISLGLLAATGLIRIPLFAELGHWSSRTAQRDGPAELSVALIAGLLLGGAVVTAGRMLWRRARTLTAAALEAATIPVLTAATWATAGAAHDLHLLLESWRLVAVLSRRRVAVWRELCRIGALSPGQGTWAVPDVPVFADCLTRAAQLAREAFGDVVTLAAAGRTDADTATRDERLRVVPAIRHIILPQGAIQMVFGGDHVATGENRYGTMLHRVRKGCSRWTGRT
ncbi:Chromate resistance protein ChrB [Streptomyces antimycoticus]|uniref:Chromate resistance protein ChrB n=1 Tax=Streptomyces antimycoticus TaxID=68175 RepID=UPI00340CCB92